MECEDFSNEDLPDKDVFLDDEDAIVYYNQVTNRFIQRNVVEYEKEIRIESSDQNNLHWNMSIESSIDLDTPFVSLDKYDSISTNQITHVPMPRWTHNSNNELSTCSKHDTENDVEKSKTIPLAA